MSVPLYVLVAEFRRDSADVQRDAGRRRFFLSRSQLRQRKAKRARQRALRTASFRPWVVVIRPINTQEVINAERPV